MFSLFHGIFNFFGHPVWSKQTQNNFVYIFGTKGSQKTPPHKGNIFWRATILIDVIYLTFCPFYGIFNFLGHPVCSKQTKNKFIYIFGTKGFQKKLHLIQENFFWRANILIEVIYLNCQSISWHFPFLGHPVW